MTVQALQDPGMTRVMQSLLSNVDDDVLFRLQVPVAADATTQWRFGDLMDAFKKGHEAILIGVSESDDPTARIALNPPVDHTVSAGMMLYYIAASRLANLEWSKFASV